MFENNPDVDAYFIDGCGRCSLWKTLQCKVNTWHDELAALRTIILDCGLKEELKWGVPCYVYNKKNVLILSAFKSYCSVNFFKGSLLNDAHHLLVKPGENTNEGRQMRFDKMSDIVSLELHLKSFIYEAIEIEKKGLKVKTKKVSEIQFPDELLTKFKEMPLLKAAFDGLTPGRQKAYLYYFSAAKQSKTRIARIEKYIEKILNGKGIND